LNSVYYKIIVLFKKKKNVKKEEAPLICCRTINLNSRSEKKFLPSSEGRSTISHFDGRHSLDEGQLGVEATSRHRGVADRPSPNEWLQAAYLLSYHCLPLQAESTFFSPPFKN
jgi:hypothetical protein